MNGRKLLFTGITVLISLAFVEFAAYVAIELYLQREERLFQRPLPRPTDEEIRAYLAKFDERLGWMAHSDTDPDGSRTTTVFPYGSETCVSLYGDSFTWGSEVDAAQAPHNQLAGMLGCRVASYGVGGYGIDQAVLQHAFNDRDGAPTVVLVLYPHDIFRSLTHNFGFIIRNRNYFQLKPKFSIDENGELKLHPIPFTTFDEIRDYVDDPEGSLPDDPFKPNGRLGSIEVGFPFSFALLRGVFHERFWRLAAASLGSKTEISYYFNDDPLASELAVRLIELFFANARSRDQRPLVAMLPTKSNVEYQLETGSCLYDRFARRLKARGIQMHCLPDFFASRLGSRNFCELVNPTDCNLHYTAEGYTIMAAALAAFIGTDDLRPDPGTDPEPLLQ